jgi:hypothetical protein
MDNLREDDEIEAFGVIGVSGGMRIYTIPTSSIGDAHKTRAPIIVGELKASSFLARHDWTPYRPGTGELRANIYALKPVKDHQHQYYVPAVIFSWGNYHTRPGIRFNTPSKAKFFWRWSGRTRERGGSILHGFIGST